MKVDALVAEIGSTTTSVYAFDKLNGSPIFLGQGLSETTPEDVESGFRNALRDLEGKLGDKISARETHAASSAAGGLKMTVHGLVHDMTVKAAQEAALGAGANLKLITASLLSDFDIKRLKALKPNIIMIAGGVDYGEAKTALANSETISSLKLNTPVVYAGNSAVRDEVREIFRKHARRNFCSSRKRLSENRFSERRAGKKNHPLRLRKTYHRGAGDGKDPNFVSEKSFPLGAVMKAALLLHKTLGTRLRRCRRATTDVFSVSEESEAYGPLLSAPEPFAKRTVEGDLGVFVNKDNLIALLGRDEIQRKMGFNAQELEKLLSGYEKIPSPKQIPLTELLAGAALDAAMRRHAGRIINLYGASGRTKAAEGKDLTAVKHFIATGGALTRLPNGKNIIENFLKRKHPGLLLPGENTKVLIDRHYVMAPLGVLADKYPEAVTKLILKSLEEL